MKKLLLLCSLMVILTIAMGCGSKAKEVEGSLDTLMTTIYDEAKPDLPETMTLPLPNDDSLPYYLGVEKLDFEEGLVCEPMMGSYAHSVVLVSVKDGTDVESLKKDIKEKVDPRKWICVEVEEQNVIVDNIGNLVILIMSNDKPEELHEAFLNLAK